MESTAVTILLAAASPIELEAEADAAGLPEAALKAGLELYHALTASLGLRSLPAAPEEPTDWPVHRFLLSDADGADPAHQLEGLDHARHVSRTLGADEVAPSILYADAQQGDYRGLLIAAADETRMALAMRAVKQS